MENYKIYGLKLKDNNDIKYIGLTKKSLEERFKKHLRDTVKRNTKNGNWIKKYKENIEIILIEENINNVELISEREIYWIKYYTDLGYNLTNGTLGGFKGEPTDETRKKLSNSQKGKVLSKETKDKIRNSLVGRKPSLEEVNNMMISKIGYKHSDKTKENIGNSLRNKPLPSSRRVEVSYFSNGEVIDIFNTYAECARFLNISKSCIYDVLIGKNKKSHGYVFKFIDSKILNNKIFEVYNYISCEIIGVFESQTECAKFLNIKKSGICSVLNGRTNKYRGYLFKYI